MIFSFIIIPLRKTKFAE